ncbi:group 1 glycosyl transferase [Sulfuricella sp. T08]|uniref:glycosyltransferase n=1 Tax=Sulfuricella sp. T08 TaxID=1632857 RepID=UPI0006179A5C|nr:glycosyltransferase [Sulfuricella sp. T08]GAO34784.1 group 1 glycosyl transferase [Sulfuricella sp. T08]
MQNQLHIVANTAVTSGGEGLAALRYAESIARAGCVVTLLSKDISDQQNCESQGMGVLKLQVAPTRHNLLFELPAQYGFIRRFCEQNKIDLIHIHGMWSPFLAVAALVARRMSIPLVISPHGCLEPWALGYKIRKKWLALKTYQGAALRSASLFVATADQEVNSIRRLDLSQPVAVIPNGVDIGLPPRRVAHEAVKTILFLSRVHPKKGLLDLVEAWARVRQSGWRITIAGGDEEGYRAKVEALIRAKGLQSDFEFVGFVDGARKQACFDAADIFVLPTYSENFGIAVAEALANELPVITTTGAPWRDLVEHRCGWWVEPGVQGVSAALIEALESDPEELRRMGQRGRQLVIDKYSWNKIGSTALEVSEWLLDASRSKPEAVQEYGQ